MNIEKIKEYIRTHVYLTYTCLFMVISAVIFLPFLLKGGTFIYLADGFNQAYPTFVYNCRYIREGISALLWGGNAVPTFDFSIGYGEDVIEALSIYGLGEIFNLLFLFVPKEYMPFCYSVTYILKIYLAGLFLAFYLCHKKADRLAVPACAVIYSFSSWALFYGMASPSMLYAMTIFPLLIYGLDELLENRENNRLSILFVLAVFLQAMGGFYFLWMDILFLAVYFLVRYFVDYSCQRNFLKKTFVICAQGILGVAMAGVILIPSIYAFFNSSRNNGENYFTFSALVPTKQQITGWLQTLAFPSGYREGLSLPVIVICALVSLYSVRKNKSLKILTAIFGAGYFIPLAGSVMNGFSYSINRWAYMLFFLLACVTAAVFGEKEEHVNKTGRIACILGLFCLAGSFLDFELTAGAVMRFAVYLFLWITSIYIYYKRKNSLLLMMFLCINVCANGLFNNGPRVLGGEGWAACFRPYSDLEEIYESQYSRASELLLEDNDDRQFSRIDICDTSTNAALLFDNYSTNSYFSLTNSNVNRFYRELMISPAAPGSFEFWGADHRQALQSILSVLYYSEEGQIKKNNLYLPLGFSYDTYITEEELQEVPALVRNDLLIETAVIGRADADKIHMPKYEIGEKEKYTENIPTDFELINVDQRDGIFHSSENSQILVTFEGFVPEKEREYYLSLSGLEYLGGEVWLDISIYGKIIRLYPGSRAGDGEFLICLPDDPEIYKDGTLSITLPENADFRFENIELIKNNVFYFPPYVEGKTVMKDISISADTISGTVKADEESLLFLSIPYSKGWKCKIDEESVPVMRVNYGFSGVFVDEGAHVIELRYISPDIRPGLLLTIAGWCLFGGIAIRKRFP